MIVMIAEVAAKAVAMRNTGCIYKQNLLESN